MGKCLLCGKEFEDVPSRTKKYCSSECRKKYKREQYKKAREECKALEQKKATVVPHSANGEPMHKTSEKYCSKCNHFSTSVNMCTYYMDTGFRRGCPVGWCDKFDRKKGRRKTPMKVI